MKKLIVLMLVCLGIAFSQSNPQKTDNVFIPKKYYGGGVTLDSAMTTKIANISTQDTVQAVVLAGWEGSHLIVEQATGTAGGLIIKAQGSLDGVNYGTNLITLDSINWTAASAKKSFDLSSKLGGFYSVRLVISGSTGPAFTGVNTYSLKIRRKP